MAKLGELLLAEGLLTREQLQEALGRQAREGGLLGRILVSLGWLTEERLVETLARQCGLGCVDPEKPPPDPALAQVVPRALAERLVCVPVTLARNVLHVAMADPTDDGALEALGFQTNKTIKALVAAPSAIERACRRLYGGAPRPPAARAADGDRLIDEALGSAELAAGGPGPTGVIDLELDPDAPPVIKLVNGLLLKAVQLRASDIHIEPAERDVRVRLRIDGVLHPAAVLPGAVRTSVASRLKVMAQMDVTERRFPQDGRMKVQLSPEAAYDFRVSCLPSVHGEKMVLRVLGQGSLRGRVEDLGLGGDALAHVQAALRNPYGMILATGPTGSGKTTTLYTFLGALNGDDVNIVTAEDPVEYNLEGITQVNVRPAIGFTFDLALRSFLRQDPDVILVGEMRDYETASIAIKAALTGHLVLSTLHTNDAPSTAVRLVDMGVEPYLVASALRIVIAQRLVRRVCGSCRREAPPTEAERAQLPEALLERAWRGAGCEACGRLGYRGRAALFEVMPVVSRDMKRIITEGGTEQQLAQAARREGMQTLKEHALALVNDGTTSLEEAMAIIGVEGS